MTDIPIITGKPKSPATHPDDFFIMQIAIPKRPTVARGNEEQPIMHVNSPLGPRETIIHLLQAATMMVDQTAQEITMEPANLNGSGKVN